ncbi:MAG: hypothetical protein N2050_03285 [Flavobacteriales bacterium]|nr:hypothetical protein [Flavobacteriales bacterium]MCX7649564.1 hypothetical protein [Flavobacteriales bacterium]MDW8431671.1 hypothetical protein [Flavobacteriales bacterium]
MLKNKDFWLVLGPVLLTQGLLVRWMYRALRALPEDHPSNALWLLGWMLLLFFSGIAVNRLNRNVWKPAVQVGVTFLCNLPALLLLLLEPRLLYGLPAFVLMPFLAIWFSRRFFDPNIR